MARIVCIGEGMLELAPARLESGSEGWKLGHGGDTLNTAIHLARLGQNVAYLTALGTDPFSEDLRSQWQAEGLDLSLVLTDPARHPGLYAISNNTAGERSFTYWRGDSAARETFSLPGIDAALAAVVQADLIVFSLISLAILPPGGRERLLALAKAVRRHGGKVAFDGNYRPRLWGSVDEARAARDAAVAAADIGLPTLDDEAMLQATPGVLGEGAVASRWQSLGCQETVVKLGARGCRLPDGRIIAPEEHLTPIDTSGAGDAFNAGYIAARLSGADTDQAALAGHRLAGWVVMRQGAIPAREP